MSGEENWITRQIREVQEEAKHWSEWRREEAKRRFGHDSTEKERLYIASMQREETASPELEGRKNPASG